MVGEEYEVGECQLETVLGIYRERHKSVNTPFIPRTTCWRPSRWRPWHPFHAFCTALPPTTIYCEPGAYNIPFVG